MTFLPAKDRLLIKRDEPVEKTEGGLYLPPTNQEIPTTGTLIACASESHYANFIEQRIVFGKYAGTDVKLNNEDYLVIKEDDVIGIITSD